MVAEVCLGHVGTVAAREVSRFAHNSREWQQLVEVCRVMDIVLMRDGACPTGAARPRALGTVVARLFKDSHTARQYRAVDSG